MASDDIVDMSVRMSVGLSPPVRARAHLRLHRPAGSVEYIMRVVPPHHCSFVCSIGPIMSSFLDMALDDIKPEVKYVTLALMSGRAGSDLRSSSSQEGRQVKIWTSARQGQWQRQGWQRTCACGGGSTLRQESQ